MKQPREDVTGADRSADDLLSLDERAMPVREALVTMAAHLSRACMVGNPAPIVRDMGERIYRPQVGDLVVEVTTTFAHRRRRDDTWYRGFGFLVEHRREWAHIDEEWARLVAEDPYAYDADDRAMEEAWYVQYGPAPVDVCRWTNADFVVVPALITSFEALERSTFVRQG